MGKRKKQRSIKSRLFGIICLFLGIVLISLFFVYTNLLKAVDVSDKSSIFVEIKEGYTTKKIAQVLEEKGLIKNKDFFVLYSKVNKLKSLKAGNYELSKSMNMEKIIDIITGGHVKRDVQNLTFKEGKRITDYAKIISDYTGESYDDVIKIFKDREYTKELISKYWFLENDILNNDIYYPLEGYLASDTFEIEKGTNAKQIIEKLLNQSDIVFTKYKDKLKDHNLHWYITMASILELEGTNTENRKMIQGIFVNRLNGGYNLGSDVTTYYASKVDMGERDLYQAEIDSNNPYNTRPMSSAGKLPVGPICNPSDESINAVLNYTPNEYFYFVADKNGKLYFTKTEGEHTAIIQKLKNQGLWLEY